MKMHDKATREPLFRVVKRDTMPVWKSMLIRVIAVLIGILVCAVLSIAVLDNVDFMKFIKTLFSGAVGTERTIWKLAKNTAVLLCISLAVTPAFRMRFWNIGAEGQTLIGALASVAVAYYLGGKIPEPLLLAVMLLAAVLVGAVWGALPAIFKARWNTNETLFTLMMNYIVIGIVRWLQGGPWEGRQGSQVIPQFDAAACLPRIFGVHCGWIIVLILVVLMHIYMRYTKHGYEIAVIGDSINTARYAGMNVGRIMMRTMFISGAISGLVGFIVASGANNTLYDGVANGVGFTAITVAWLSQLNAFAMVVISAMLAVLTKGAETLQTRLAVPTSISEIITGILLFSMLGCEFFINFRLILRAKKQRKQEEKAEKEAVK